MMDYPEIVVAASRKGAEGINPLLSGAEHNELFETVTIPHGSNWSWRG